MTLTPVLVPEAKTDVAEAYMWYEDQSLGLGMEFLRCVEAALFSLQRTPLTYPRFSVSTPFSGPLSKGLVEELSGKR